MKTSSAVKKLKGAGWEVKTTWSSCCAQRGDALIEFRSKSVNGLEYVTGIEYRPEKSGGTTYYSSLRNLLIATGDMKPPPARGPAGARSQVDLIRRLCVQTQLNDSDVRELNPRYKSEVVGLIEKTFPAVFKDARRYNYNRMHQRSGLESKAIDIWNRALALFAEDHPDLMPLREVSIRASVPGWEGVQFARYNAISSHVNLRVPVFARTGDEARLAVRALMGDLAQVNDLGVRVISTSGSEALKVYEENFAGTVSAESLQLKDIRSQIENTEKALASLREEVKLAEKKLELSDFLHGMGRMSTMLTQGINIDEDADESDEG